MYVLFTCFYCHDLKLVLKDNWPGYLTTFIRMAWDDQLFQKPNTTFIKYFPTSYWIKLTVLLRKIGSCNKFILQSSPGSFTVQSVVLLEWLH